MSSTALRKTCKWPPLHSLNCIPRRILKQGDSAPPQGPFPLKTEQSERHSHGIPNDNNIKNIVLVHGAWADGSSWSKVVPLLQAKGFHVTCTQNPLSGLADDVKIVHRILDAQDGPVILAGHSYGGIIITEEAGTHPKVAGLVYVAAFAPDAGGTITSVTAPFPPTPGLGKITPIADGFLLLSEQGVLEDFAQDLPTEEKSTMVATQGPTHGSIFTAAITKPAWHEKPSWYAVSLNDRTINPEYEKHAAAKMGATTIELPASHVAMLAKPNEVADLILQAAASVNAAQQTAVAV